MLTVHYLFESDTSDIYVKSANKKLKKKFRKTGNITTTLKSKWDYFQKNKKKSNSLQITPQDKTDYIAASAPRYSSGEEQQRRWQDKKNLWMAIQHFKRR